MNIMDEFAEYRTDNLLLLMGTNPLPNYVAARLLAKLDGNLFLVVTDETRPLTEGDPLKRAPDRLAKLLGYPEEKIHYVYVEPSNPINIRQKVDDIVTKYPGDWGLHYTGGKKSMAAHAYLAMENALDQKDRQGVQQTMRVYSYLDADDLNLVVEKPRNGIYLPISVRNVLAASLADLIFLHGQIEAVNKLKQLAKAEDGTRVLGIKPNRLPFKPEVSRSLLDAWQNAEADMAEWTRTRLRFESKDRLLALYASPEDSLPAIKQHIWDTLILSYEPGPLPDASKNRVKKLREELRIKRWQDTRLPAGIESIGGRTIAELAAEWHESVGHVAEWLAGLWLEDYVLESVRGVAIECQITDYALGLESNIWEPKNVKTDVFESDVLVMQGHRLFYISVTTDAGKGLNKSKLFEAYVRAQFLGGDQAEVALVTFFKDAQKLEQEIKTVHGPRARVRVFGFPELPNLSAEFRRWFGS
jgi:hypothetical protein